MIPAQISKINPDEFSRCEERNQKSDPGESPGSIQKTDAAIKEQIYQAFWKDAVLRSLEYHEIDVRVKNGVVYLYGHIVSTTSQSRVEDILRVIPSILGIKNNLVLDDRLTLEVATALGALEHTHACKFFTGASHGVVSLQGIVRDENVKMLAEQCAADNPNVRAVINNIRGSGTEQGFHEQPFMQPAIGENIYFVDGIAGVVKQVIINPNNRRVTGMIIEGQFPDQKQDLEAPKNNQLQRLEKTVVISVDLIRYLTNSSGFLTIKSTETTQYQDFNPLYFTSPPIDWTLPFPYCPADVLFHVEAGEIENQIMVDPDIAQLNISAQPTSPQTALPVDILASWEDDGGQIIQTGEAVAVAGFAMSTTGIQDNIQKEKHNSPANDSLGG